MQKSKEFKDVYFSAETIRDLVISFESMAKKNGVAIYMKILKVDHPDCSWSYDNLDEFVADYRANSGKALLRLEGCGLTLSVQVWPRSVHVEIRAKDRPSIENVLNVLEAKTDESRLSPSIATPPEALTVFIGHGRNQLWRDLKEHLCDKHGIKVIAYETGARAGYTIRDILEDMIDKSTFALLVMTAEDEQADGSYRARQNVIHEAGLFQGRLGFSRAIMVVEEGASDFSNVYGVQQIRFAKGNIKETYGEVLATIRREFGSKG